MGSDLADEGRRVLPLDWRGRAEAARVIAEGGSTEPQGEQWLAHEWWIRSGRPDDYVDELAWQTARRQQDEWSGRVYHRQWCGRKCAN